MAKKKKVAKQKSAKGRAAKKTTPSKPKKPLAAAASSKKPRSPKTAGSRGTSVDTLLKKYEKERKTQESQLSGSLKKIDELELKATKLQEQIAKLKEGAKSTQLEIDQLDSRRDAEVAEVLGRLGNHGGLVGSSVDEIQAAAGAYADAGVDELVIADFNLPRAERVDILGRLQQEILEGFR